LNLEELLRLQPKFHLDEEGQPISWGIGFDVLEFLDDRLSEAHTTLETGAGMSTVVFALNGCQHTVITPAERESVLIREFCEEHRISLSALEFVQERSEFALPHLQCGALDVALIDGRHAFPTPFIDWFYTAARLRKGGLMMIDDIQLKTGEILRDFMMADPRWRQVEELGKTSVFEKLRDDVHEGEWNTQPYLLQFSDVSSDV
jgi:predicted O-methyltransferase YrrM